MRDSRWARRVALLIGVPLAVLGGVRAVTWAASTLHTWATGDTLSATDLNGNFTALDQRVAALEAQAHPPSAFRAWLSTAGPTITNAAFTPISYDHVDFDLGSEYNHSTGIFSPAQAGIYLLNCGAWFVPLATGTRFQVEIFVNGTAAANELSGDDVHSSAASLGLSTETTLMAKLAVGDQVTCGVGLSGASQTMSAGLPMRNRFEGFRIY
jgi:hypothetical protein